MKEPINTFYPQKTQKRIPIPGAPACPPLEDRLTGSIFCLSFICWIFRVGYWIFSFTCYFLHLLDIPCWILDIQFYLLFPSSIGYSVLDIGYSVLPAISFICWIFLVGYWIFSFTCYFLHQLDIPCWILDIQFYPSLFSRFLTSGIKYSMLSLQ